CATFHRFDAW
nr:immunoglobulin heavy chain junction region [Macaca mulatta]